MSTDATPAYRGYRLQALYTLFRILNSSSESRLVFHPEGNEDLFVYDESLSNQEVIQIKAYTTPLQLSDFKPSKKLSFFNRITPQLKLNTNMKVKICSFGEFGPELLGAITGNETHLNNVARKLSKHGFVSETDAQFMLAKVEPELTDEKVLTENVFSLLGKIMTGVDPDRAFEILNFWLYICAEQKKSITRDDVIEKINSVGRFLSERAAYHKEWHTVIVPIEETVIDERWQATLSDEFYQGVSTRYEHILANLDIPRNEKLKRISEQLEQSRVVIIHGASGQGKTTLAYRFIKDYLPNDWRFHIRNVENKKHALSIATALTGHANAMGIPLVVYLDVSPSDNDWVELVKQLSAHPNIRVLVTVREEDWRKASVVGYEFTFEEIDLNLTKEEAESLYHSFIRKKDESLFLDFGDAWHRFGGEGPLLEFAYLINQGTTLRERLQHQIICLEQEVENGSINPSTLQLLFLIVVASAYESRVDVKALVKHLEIRLPGSVFRRLEQEYLIRVTDQTIMLAQGLHPIRSEMLVNLLTDTLFQSWIDAAQVCLPLIFEEDIETFLMHAFSRRQEETTQLLEFITTYTPHQWTAYAGVVRALIWLGIVRYIEENDTFIKDSYSKLKDGLFSVVDYDITNVVGGVTDKFLNLLKDQIPESGLEELRELKTRQTDKNRVFHLAKNWLTTREFIPATPKSVNDWLGASYCGYWLGRLQLNCQLATVFTSELLDLALRESSLETMSYLILGTYSVHPTTLTTWVDDNYKILVEKYCDETFTFYLEDNEGTVTSHFILDYKSFPPTKQVTDQANLDRKNFVHDETMSRLHLLRRLFPHRNKYASKGYGHRNANLTDQVDDSIKHMDPTYLGNEWLITINAIFRRLVEKKLRAETWQEYLDEVLKLRNSVVTLSFELENALQEYFKRRKFHNLFQQLNVHEFDAQKRNLNQKPALPQVAVDEWGLSEDIPSGNETGSGKRKKIALANKKYAPYQKYLREYTSSFTNFISQCINVLVINAAIGRGRDASQVRRIAEEQGIKTNMDHLSMINLADACKALPNLQREFRKLFGHLMDQNTLQSLEHQEKRILTRFTPMWYFFAFEPYKISRNASEEFGNFFSRTRSNFIKQLSKELSLFSNESRKLSITAKKVPYKGEKAICISVDHKGIPTDLESILLTHEAINNALSQANDKRIQQFVLDIYWRYVIVIPLLDGQKINNSAWEIHLLSRILENDPSEVSLYPIEIADDWLVELGIHIWGHPRLEVVFEMVKGIGSIIEVLNHLIDVLSLPDINQNREIVFQQYLEKLVQRLQTAFEKVVESLGILTTVISDGIKQTPLSSRLPIITEITEQLLDNLQQIEGGTLEIDSIKMWLLSMEKAFGLSGMLASHWVFYVMHDALTE